jgi:hypothetical protein
MLEGAVKLNQEKAFQSLIKPISRVACSLTVAKKQTAIPPPRSAELG